MDEMHLDNWDVEYGTQLLQFAADHNVNLVVENGKVYKVRRVRLGHSIDTN